MEIPETRYARAPDGIYLAYQVWGDGPVDIVWQFDWFGNVDIDAESRVGREWNKAIAAFGRIILHDRRGTGLSSRNVPPPNLEQRAADTIVILDAIGSDRVVLAGMFEGGAPNVLLAASRPELVRALVWFEPSARSAWASDYPWGRSPGELEDELRLLETWGTTEYGRDFRRQETALGNETTGDDAAYLGRQSRHTCTPDVAIELARIWNETDVRTLLPLVQVPSLFVVHAGRPDSVAETEHIASHVPRSEVVRMPGSAWTHEEIPAWAEEIRRFVGVERRPVGLDTVLATVLFTDIVGSTERQAEIGDRAWKAVVERHHDVVRRALERWHGVERDTAGDGFFATFDGPARAVRCALEIREVVTALGLAVRAGVHTGECEIVDRKVGGLAVSIGSRISTLARPSEVLVSQTVKDLTAGSGLAFSDAGEHELRGVPDRWHLYRVMAS